MGLDQKVSQSLQELVSIAARVLVNQSTFPLILGKLFIFETIKWLDGVNLSLGAVATVPVELASLEDASSVDGTMACQLLREKASQHFSASSPWLAPSKRAHTSSPV